MGKEPTPRTDEPSNLSLSLPIAKISLAFYIPPIFDLEKFKASCEKAGVRVKIETEEENIKGLVLVPCEGVNFNENLKLIQRKLENPLREVISESNFERELGELLKNSRYFRNVVLYLKSKYQEFHERRVSKEEVISQLYQKIGRVIGSDGCIMLAEAISNDEQVIKQRYLTLESYVIKHFAIEFFLQQQIEQGYILLLNIHDSDNTFGDSNKWKIEQIKGTFEKKSLELPNEGRINNVYFSQENRNVLMTVNPTKKSKALVTRLLSLKKAKLDILFVKFLMEKERQIVVQGKTDFDLNALQIMTVALESNPKQVEKIIGAIGAAEGILFPYLEEFLNPILQYLQELTPTKELVDKKILDDLFSADIKYTGKYKFNPPAWFFDFLFSKELEELKQEVQNNVSDITVLLTKFLELKGHLLKLKHELEMRNIEKASELTKIVVKVFTDLARLLKGV